MPRRVRRAVGAVALVALALVVGSYVRAMVRPSNVGLGVRSVEWVRDHGGAWLVNDVERAWYSLNAPSKGGPALHALPSVGRAPVERPHRTPVARPRVPARTAYAPPRVPPLVRPALRGEGVWRAAGPAVAGRPPVLITAFRPDRSYPRMVAGVAWIDHTRTRLALYPGRYEPPSASHRGQEEVPPSTRAGLVATFNSGFKLKDARGGFVAGGRVDAPLVPGEATLVGYVSGRVDVRAWRGRANGGSRVAFARQNLPLIVAHGRLNPNLADGPAWGATLGNAIRVWRTGVGVDRHRNLIYAAANDQTVRSLAAILQRAGAVRAMELDINSEWASFITYGLWQARRPAQLLPTIGRSATRYLTPDDRDFFAVYRRRPR